MNFIHGFMRVFNCEGMGITAAVILAMLLLVGIFIAIGMFVERNFK